MPAITNPRTEALAYRIWGHCTPKEWDCTIGEIADALGEPAARVYRVLQIKNWTGRVRAAIRHTNNVVPFWARGDDAAVAVGLLGRAGAAR